MQRVRAKILALGIALATVDRGCGAILDPRRHHRARRETGFGEERYRNWR